MNKFDTDKYTHGYIPIYEPFFNEKKDSKNTGYDKIKQIKTSLVSMYIHTSIATSPFFILELLACEIWYVGISLEITHQSIFY